MTWFAEGDRNTSFFHNHVNGKRKKLQLKRIKSGSGFTNEGDASEFSLLNNVPSMVTMDQNLELSRLPTIEEVRQQFLSLVRRVLVVLMDSLACFIKHAGIFVKARSIFENILLTQEIVTDIRLRGKPANVVIKLDMAKAYDRVSWKYLLHVPIKMGFSEHFINMVWNLMSNNWSLNKLFEDKSFVGFGMSKWSDPLNHLAYADDTIIFASAHPPSLSKIMAVLGNYEKILGQMINKDKSSYYMHSKVANGLFQVVGAITEFAREKLLSFGGKETLISSVLQNMPVHMLSVLDPPNNILGHLHKTFARFFWSTKEEGRSRHWASWQNLCLPKEEGGLGFRSLNDVSRALFAKLWWGFRTTKSLWSNFMWNKYCKKELPIVVHFRGGSHVWRQMLNPREEVEHEIVWELMNGTTNIWHENWTGLGALYHILPEDFPINEGFQEVAELRQREAWDD
ncbi:uncharacterized protein LOC142177241 [Nicotiana tabacum]|uniref:Uncharacterized protein LOC142177241 n=1 Tax=Nicotiana tabacum TaxID=4097 RepID=A0AC58TX50_TOBAC